jgi:uncharacterized membrane protein (UPF0136 family)
MLEFAKLYLLFFGVLTIAGGVMGFVKAGSRASLIAGGVSGALLLLAGYLVGAGNLVAGLVLGLVLSLALAGQFAPKFFRTRKVMPAGMMAVLGIVGIAVTALGLLQRS